MKNMPQVSRLDHARSAKNYQILYTTSTNRHMKTNFNFNTVGERPCLSRSTHDLGSKQGLIFHLQAALSDFSISSILAPWYNGPEVGSLRDLEVVDFFVA